jgi:hypothetical protein
MTVRFHNVSIDQVAEFLNRSGRHKHVPTATVVRELPKLPGKIDEEYISKNGGMFYLQFRVFKEWGIIVVSEYLELLDDAAFFDCKCHVGGILSHEYFFLFNC